MADAGNRRRKKDDLEPPSPGSLTRNSRRDLRPDEPGEPTPAGDEAGSPGAETDGGLVASPGEEVGIAHWADLKRQGEEVADFDNQEGAPYGGSSGGSVGGTPNQKRSEGGLTHHGIAPKEDKLPADTTIGHDPQGRPRK